MPQNTQELDGQNLVIEKIRHYQLEYQRARAREEVEFKDSVAPVKKPSFFKFLIYLCLAGTLDILDWAALTGIGLILTYFLKFLFGPILFLHGWRAGKRVKAMGNIQDSLVEAISHIQKRAYTYSRRYMMAVKYGRKIKFLRKPIRNVARNVSKIRRAVLRNPAVKNTTAIVVDFIPVIDLLPWRTLGIYLTYQDEKKTYEESLPVVQEYAAARSEEMAQEEELAEMEMEEELTGIQESGEQNDQALPTA